MTPLHLLTVLQLLIIGNLLAMAMVLAYEKRASSRGPVRLFILSKLLQATGWTLICLRGIIPLVLSAHVGNPLIMAGFALEVGVLVIPWRIRTPVNALLAIQVLAGCLLLWALGTTPGALVTISGSVVATIYATGGVTLLRDRSTSRVQKLTGILFLIFVPVMLLRVAHSASTGAGLLNTTHVQSITFVVQFSFLLIGTLAFLLLMKEADDQLLNKSEARERERLLLQSQFMDMLTHELRAALSVVSMSGSSLRHQLTSQPPEVLRRLDSIQMASDAMRGVIERCIQLDRLDRDDQPVLCEDCTLSEVIDAIRPRLKSGADRLDIAIPAESRMWADRQLLTIMLENLLDNALKYSLPGSRIQVEAQTTADDAGHPQTTLQIRNLANTAGLPDPEQVFLRYYRGPEAHMHTGTGLGLYLVRTLTRVQDGDVGYRVVGDATVEFSLRLPATP